MIFRSQAIGAFPSCLVPHSETIRLDDGGLKCKSLLREVVGVWTCSAIQEGELTSFKPGPQDRVKTVQKQNKTKLHYN